MRKRNRLGLTVASIGIACILTAIGLLLYSSYRQQQNAKETTQTVATLKAMIPTITPAAPDDRANPALSVMELEGVNYCGIIELPTYGTALPLYAIWETGFLSRFPCRYLGSIYDKPLIIGGSDAKGQFDFMETISLDDTIFVTDLTGDRYSYRVTDIEKTEDVSTKHLTEEPADLILFAKNRFSLNYTILRCSFSAK